MNLKRVKDAVSGPTFDIEAELNSLLAEELQAAYDYFKVAPFIMGLEGQAVRDEFFKHYEEEMEHAKKLIDRLNVLGLSCFVNSLQDIPQFTSLAPVDRPLDFVSQCEGNRDAESAAIDHYNQVIHDLGDTDLVTRDLLKEILADEEEHYSDLQDFINDNHV